MLTDRRRRHLSPAPQGGHPRPGPEACLCSPCAHVFLFLPLVLSVSRLTGCYPSHPRSASRGCLEDQRVHLTTWPDFPPLQHPSAQWSPVTSLLNSPGTQESSLASSVAFPPACGVCPLSLLRFRQVATSVDWGCASHGSDWGSHERSDT